MTDLASMERHDNGVAVITLTHGKVNALSTALLERIGELAQELMLDPARAVVITGGSRLFAAGADISEFAADPDPASERFAIAAPAQVARVGGAFLDALNAVAGISCPTIASVSGFALGGGCELALACDLRIASTRAVFGQPEILLGIIPGGGGTQRLARLLGPARAKDMIFSGRQVRADEALAIGLVDRVVEPEELETAALGWASEFAAGPTAALALAKEAIDRGLDGALSDGVLIEQRCFVESFTTADATAGVSSFLAHGPGNAEFA